MQQHLTPWMVESAHRYLCAAELLRYKLLDVAQVNAALGMEILLKSFVAKPNSNHGEFTETYKFNDRLLRCSHEQLQSSGDVSPDRKDPDGHDLLTLFYAIPEAIRREIGLERRKVSVAQYRHVFTQSRYRYEKIRKDKKRQCASVLIDVLRDLIPHVVDFYRKRGCEDPFIVCYGMTPADFQPKPGKEPEPS